MIFRPPWGIVSMVSVAVSTALWDSVTPSERRTRTIRKVYVSSATRSWTVFVEPSRTTDNVAVSISTCGWRMCHTKATAATISTISRPITAAFVERVINTPLYWPGGKFCVSVFRQSQEYALERADFVKDPHGDQRPRQPESVCATTGVNADAGCRGILFQGDHPTLRSANMSSSWLSTKSQFWYRACQCFTMRCEAR